MEMSAVAKQPPSPETVMAEHKRLAEKEHTERKAQTADTPANLPAKAEPTNIAIPDGRTSVQAYLDEISPTTAVGRIMKTGKEHVFGTVDDGREVADDIDFIALLDQTAIGYAKFNGEGNPPDRIMGLLYDGFTLPPRETLSDTDQSLWQLGLNKQPADPWVHQIYVVLQRGDTGELFTYIASSVTTRRAVGNLLRHYDRMRKTDSNSYPLVRLKVGGFNHRDERVGWVKVPVFAVVGRAPKESAAKPDTSISSDMNDQIPF
jgi:hypothetical protein